MTDKIRKLEPENERLRDIEHNYNTVERVLGKEQVDKIITTEKEKEQEKVKIETSEAVRIPKQRLNRNRDYER